MMSQTILSNSAAAIPKTNAERSSKPATRAALYGLAPGEEKEDEPGEEMAREARVWKTYIRETDRWDKEMVDERNSSLDVLLIFAALFSAISTAFIIVSLGDLKPDSAQQAVLTQREILQALVQISNGQLVSLPTRDSSDLGGFTASHSAVVVNILWLLSLALSVGVSLIAMLAKGWCYQFMRGRLGPTYNQARRRQQKWDGIETWKMQEVLELLPGVMHLALLLFAVGMCVYLWKVHVAVAIPVTAVTSCVMCGYTLATLLPAVCRDCPYRTPFTPVPVWRIKSAVRFVVFRIWNLTLTRGWYRAASICDRIQGWFSSFDTTHVSHPKPGDEPVIMDETTARMLAWLITNCDDSRSVDTALQGLAGARPGLPCLPLLLCGVHTLLPTRLSAYARFYVKPEEGASDDVDKLLVALRYTRSYAALFNSDIEHYVHTSAAKVALLETILKAQFSSVMDSYKMMFYFLSIFCRSNQVFGEQAKAFCLATASFTVLVAQTKHLHTHYEDPCKIMSRYREYTTAPVARILQQYTMDGTTLDDDTGYLLVYAVAQHLTQYDSNEPQQHMALCDTLLQVCLAPSDGSARTSHMAIVALAAVAFARHSYPAGEVPPQLNQSNRSRRAVQVLRHYQGQVPDEHTTAALFAFGLVAVLPHLDPDVSRIQMEAWARLQRLFLKGIYSLNHGRTIYTLPRSYSFNDHTSSFAEPTAGRQALSGHLTVAPSWLSTLQNRVGPKVSDPVLYVPALVVLCRARSPQVQKLCISILDSQPVGLNVRHTVELLPKDWFERDLTCEPMCTDTSVIGAARFYLRLLVASVMLCPSVPLGDRKNYLRRLGMTCDDFDLLEHSSPDHSMPTMDTILAHVDQDADQRTAPECMRQTMQLIYDFCDASDIDANPDPAWAEKLHEITRRHRPAVYAVDPAGKPDATRRPLSSVELQDDAGSGGPGTVPKPEVWEQDSTELHNEVPIAAEAV